METTCCNVHLSAIDVGRGRPLVFLHGFPLNRSAWQKQVDAFRFAYRVIAPDLRGFGSSDARPGPATMAHYAADLRELLRRLETGPVVLVGHSMGGYVALEFARQFPEMLSGLVLVGTRAGADTEEGAAGRRPRARRVEAEGVHVVVDAMAARMISPDNHHVHMHELVRGLMAASNPVGVIAALQGMADRPDSTAMLARLAMPTLVVTGEDDALVPPAESRKLALAIPGAEFQMVPHAGHLVAFERPNDFNRVLITWLKRTARAAA